MSSKAGMSMSSKAGMSNGSSSPRHEQEQVHEEQGRHEQELEQVLEQALACSSLDEALLGAGMSKSSFSSRHEQAALRQVYEEQEQGMSWEQGKRVYQELFVY